MTQVRSEKAPLFYQLTHKEWLETVKDLTGAEVKVLYYIRSLDPFGDHKLEYSVTQMAAELGLSKGAVSKVIRRLEQKKLVELRVFSTSSHNNLECQIRTGLKIPNNIILLFQPAHSPQLNPIERVWQYIKEFLSWELFDSLEDLRNRVREILADELSTKLIASLTGRQSILSSLSVADI
ncbi:MarR family transcriptional regulator [Gloeocapsopsis dulcis]|nr:helix-turn-helix domain-containing protein [Gloeocapsopsis dulcis]WNN92233.1 MarR family transcriptional regulator [Gloeocapsopsis dulcis]